MSSGVSTSTKPAAWWVSRICLDQPAARQDAALERLAAQVEVAVLEAHRLVDLGIRVVDDEGRRPGAREDADVRGAQLHVARRQLGVLGAGQSRGDASPDLEHELRPHRGRDLVGRRRLLGVDDDLGDAVPVAQVQEDELAQVTAAVDPAGEGDVAADVVGARRRRR